MPNGNIIDYELRASGFYSLRVSVFRVSRVFSYGYNYSSWLNNVECEFTVFSIDGYSNDKSSRKKKEKIVFPLVVPLMSHQKHRHWAPGRESLNRQFLFRSFPAASWSYFISDFSYGKHSPRLGQCVSENRTGSCWILFGICAYRAKRLKLRCLVAIPQELIFRRDSIPYVIPGRERRLYAMFLNNFGIFGWRKSNGHPKRGFALIVLTLIQYILVDYNCGGHLIVHGSSNIVKVLNRKI